MRTFIALELPERFAGEVSQLSRVLSYEIEGRYGERGSHNIVLAFLGDINDGQLVLAFLGDINDGQIMPVIAAMNAAAGFAHPVPLSPDKLGKFGKKSDATLWLGIKRSTEMDKLVGDLWGLLDKRNIDFDQRPFKPHVTIARHAKMFDPLPEALPFPSDDVATKMTLFKSEMNRKGATYTPLYSL